MLPRNTIVWESGMSHWPYSHLFLPVLGVFLLNETTMSPLARIGIIVLAAVLVEVWELFTDTQELKSDVVMDLMHAAGGAAIGIAVMYALDIPAWGVIGGKHTVRAWAGLALLICGFLFAHHQLCWASVEEHNVVDAERAEGGRPYEFPKYALYCILLVAVFSAVMTGWSKRQRPARVKWWHAAVLPLIAAALASPLFIQPEDQEGLKWTTLVGAAIGGAALLVALYRRPGKVRAFIRSNIQ